VRNRRSTQSSCVGATILFTTWLRLNLPPPRQAPWEASALRERRPARHRACLGGKPFRRSGNPPHAPLTRPLPRHRACLGGEPFRRRTNPSHAAPTRPPRHRACLDGGREGSRLAGRGSCRIIRSRVPGSVRCVRWLEATPRSILWLRHARSVRACCMAGCHPFWVVGVARVTEYQRRFGTPKCRVTI